MTRKKWIYHFCRKYLTRIFLICAIPSIVIFLIFLAIGLIYNNSNDPAIFVPLYVGVAIFVICSLPVFFFVRNAKQEEKIANNVFIPKNVEKFSGMLYLSDNWIVICGRRVIHRSNLIKITRDNRKNGKGFEYFYINFYTKNNKKPISYSINIVRKRKETIDLTSHLYAYARKINCPLEQEKFKTDYLEDMIK